MATTVPATGMLGRYQVLRPLAKGGMAEVLLARALGLAGFARYVVIKRIRVENVSDQKAIDMFLDEARLVAALHHRNIVQVLDVGEEDGKYFFVMEYVHGRDTRELLRKVKEEKQQLPLEHVISIASAAAAGLHYAHEQRGPDRMPLGIVHRDISPGNILVAFDGGVKVVDFGIAKAHARATDTQAGERKGKVGYMSPEQCRAEPVDRRTDVFQLGIVLWELCTVKRLFNKDGRFETMAMIADGEVPLPSRFRPDLPAELEQIVMKALAKNPDERYQTADELRIALESFAAGAALTLSAGRLSDYLKGLFGDVPEPWLAEDLPPPDPAVLERVRTSQRFSVPTIPPELVASATERAARATVAAATEEAAATASAAEGAAPSASADEPPASIGDNAAMTATAGESATSVATTGEIAAPVASTDAIAAPAAVASAIEPPADAAKPTLAEGPPPAPRASEPEVTAAPAAKPSAAGAPSKAASATPMPKPVSWPVDPRSVRARRRWLIALGVLAVGATAFVIAAFSGPEVPPPAPSSAPVAAPPTAADAEVEAPAVERDAATEAAEQAAVDASVDVTAPHEPPLAGSEPQTVDAENAPERTAPDASASAAPGATDATSETLDPTTRKPTRRTRPRSKPSAKPATPPAVQPDESASPPAQDPSANQPEPAPGAEPSDS